MLEVRFPFTFMAVLSVAVAVWTVGYLGTSRLTDPIARAIALTATAIFLGLASYQFYRRLKDGKQA